MTAQADPPARESDDAPIDVGRIERVNLYLIAVATFAAFVFLSKATALGVVLGGVTMATSFRIIVAAMRAVFGRSAKRTWPRSIANHASQPSATHPHMPCARQPGAASRMVSSALS